MMVSLPRSGLFFSRIQWGEADNKQRAARAMCAAAAARAQLSCSAQPQSPGGAPTAAAVFRYGVILLFKRFHQVTLQKYISVNE